MTSRYRLGRVLKVGEIVRWQTLIVNPLFPNRLQPDILNSYPDWHSLARIVADTIISLTADCNIRLIVSIFVPAKPCFHSPQGKVRNQTCLRLLRARAALSSYICSLRMQLTELASLIVFQRWLAAAYSAAGSSPSLVQLRSSTEIIQ